jgi:hypothetical protein
MSNLDIEEGDLMDPKDELKKKIVALANTMREWNEKSKEARESVRKQLQVIIDLGLNKRKMEKTELRKLINEIFLYHGIHPSWLRKLLPEGLKYTSKTRISYLQRQEIEKERQRLLLPRQSSESQKKAEEQQALPHGSIGVTTADEDVDSETSSRLIESRPELGPEKLEYEACQASDPETLLSSKESTRLEFVTTIQDKLNAANEMIEKLKADLQLLSEPFVAKAYLQVADQDIPLVAQIDPVKKAITSIRVVKNY